MSKANRMPTATARATEIIEMRVFVPKSPLIRALTTIEMIKGVSVRMKTLSGRDFGTSVSPD
jgi:hypothetical protein